MSLTKVSPSLIAVANNVTSNTYGSANTISSFTFDASGVITAASNTALQVNTADIVNGAVSDAKIAAVANTKITGLITSGQIANVANTQITGNIISSQITSVQASSLPSGSVLQVVSMTTTTGTNSTTTAYVDTAVTLSITPSSSSNKILVIYNLNGIYKSATSASNSIGFNLVRGSTSLGDFGLYFGSTGTALATVGSSGVGMYLDSPSTTSSTTYKVQIKNMTNASFVGINVNGDISSMTLMEIKG